MFVSVNVWEEVAQVIQLSVSEAVVWLFSKEVLVWEVLEEVSGWFAKQWVVVEILGSVDFEHVFQLVCDYEDVYLVCEVELGKVEECLKIVVQEVQCVDEMSEDVMNYDESVCFVGDLE